MNELRVFENTDFGSVRTVEADGNIMFCGNDVARALGYQNSRKALKDHCNVDGVTFRYVIDDLGRSQNTKFISEGNLYRLVAGSKLPSAVKFEKWIFDEVLPTIRKTGSYGTAGSEQAEINRLLIEQMNKLSEAVANISKCIGAGMNSGTVGLQSSVQKQIEDTVLKSNRRMLSRGKVVSLPPDMFYLVIDAIAKEVTFEGMSSKVKEACGRDISQMSFYRFKKRISCLKEIAGGYEVLTDYRTIYRCFPDKVEKMMV